MYTTLVTSRCMIVAVKYVQFQQVIKLLCITLCAVRRNLSSLDLFLCLLGQRVHLDSSSSSASGISMCKGSGTKPKPLNLIVTNSNGCESTSTENDGLSNPRK